MCRIGCLRENEKVLTMAPTTGRSPTGRSRARPTPSAAAGAGRLVAGRPAAGAGVASDFGTEAISLGVSAASSSARSCVRESCVAWSWARSTAASSLGITTSGFSIAITTAATAATAISSTPPASVASRRACHRATTKARVGAPGVAGTSRICHGRRATGVVSRRRAGAARSTGLSAGRMGKTGEEDAGVLDGWPAAAARDASMRATKRGVGLGALTCAGPACPPSRHSVATVLAWSADASTPVHSLRRLPARAPLACGCHP